ncbi:MAG: hypothetical protein HYY96_10165 [Candidatus Tectomicrobia bacterium]|nr:hypothetical protein [Candidatus Tectomicrobia bacterium]
MAQPEHAKGRGIAWLALLIALVALVLSIIAYQRTGGLRPLQQQVERLRTEVPERARKEAAEALGRLQEKLRPKPDATPAEKAAPGGAPGAPQPAKP